MNVALIGGSGNAGSRILKELVQRGHRVTVVVRRPERVPPHDRVVSERVDVHDGQTLARKLSGHDAVISAVHFLDCDARVLVDAVRAAAVPRYLVVGGAGSLEVGGGQRVIDSGGVPAPYVPESQAGIFFLDTLKGVEDIEWTFLSPSAEITPGERTGVFRLGGNALLRDADGRSWISYEDYAVAMVDELESPRHVRQRFTVGY